MNTRAIKTILIPGSPVEMTKIVFEYLDIESLRYLSAANKTWMQECQQYAKDNFQQTYFAVGMPIETNTKYYACTRSFKAYHARSFQYHRSTTARESFPDTEIMKALICKYNNTEVIRIFTNLDDANKFGQFQSKAICFEFIDRLDTYQKPAIYIVKINNILIHKPRMYFIQDQFADIKGLSYRYRKGMEMRGIEIRADNCEKVLYAKLKTSERTHFFSLGNQMNKAKELWGEFSQCWVEELKDKMQYNEKNISKAVIKLFSSYSHPLFSYTTRYYQDDVNNFIQFMQVNPPPTLMEISGVLKSFRIKIDIDENSNKNSVFSQMIDFILDKLTDINEANKLAESKTYFNCIS